MAIVKINDLIKQCSDLIGDRNDDEALALLENLTDTLKANEKTPNLKELEDKIKALEDEKLELDNEWRNKYKARFNQSEEPPDQSPIPPNPEAENNEKMLEFTDIFKEG